MQDAIQAVLTAVSDRFAPLNEVVDTRWLVDVEVLAGRVRFEQILMNLIINAWKEIEACEDQQIWIGSTLCRIMPWPFGWKTAVGGLRA